MPLSKAQADTILESMSLASRKEQLRWRILDCKKFLKRLPLRWRLLALCIIAASAVIVGLLSTSWLLTTAAAVIALMAAVGIIQLRRRRLRRHLARLEQELRQLQMLPILPHWA